MRMQVTPESSQPSQNWAEGSPSPRARKRLYAVITVLFASALLFVLGPVIRCAFRHYLFESYVRVQLEMSSCGDAVSRLASRSCGYIFAFEGEKDADAIQFGGSGLRHAYDAGRRVF